MDVGAIPATEIACWLDLQGIADPRARRDYYRVVRIVDREWLRNRKDWEGGDEEEGEQQVTEPATPSKRRARAQRG